MGDARGAGGCRKDERPGTALFLWAGEISWGQLELDPALGIARWVENTDEAWRFFGSTRTFGNMTGDNSQRVLVPRGLPRAGWKSTDLLFHGRGGIHLGGIWVRHHQVENIGP